MHPLEPQIQTSTLQGLPEVLRQRGVIPDTFLAPYGLSTESLIVRKESISYRQYAEMLHAAAQVCEAPHLGLLLSRAESHMLYSEGTLGMLLKNCATVGEVLKAITRYYYAISHGAEYRVDVDGPQASFIREGLVPGLKHDRILQDVSLSDFLNVLRKSMGADWQPTRLLFTYNTPEDLAPYQEYLQCPLEFRAPKQAILFPADDLLREINVSDFLMEQLAGNLITRSLAQLDVSFTNAVIHVIDVMLPTGICCANSVATVFEIHSRTLHRRLKREGTTFEAILDERRKNQAVTYLKNPAIPIAKVGVAVGYSAPEAFTRAFRRWYGTPPQDWRREHT